MTFRHPLLLFCSILFCTAFPIKAEIPAQCNTVYAIHDADRTDSQLLTYSLLQHQLNTLGPLHFGSDLEGLALHPFTYILYATSGQLQAHLYTLNGLTGELTLVGPLGFDNVVALAFHPDGSLWGWSDQGLLQIDPYTGIATLITPAVNLFPVQDLAWEPQGNLLYAAVNDMPPHSSLWVYDQDHWQRVCEGLPPKVEALEFRPDGFLLYGFHQDQQLSIHLYDPVTCHTIITNWLTTDYNDIEGIAWPLCPTHQELLRDYLASLPEVEQVTLQTDGTILVTRLGEIHWGKLDEMLQPGLLSPTGQVELTEVEDLNQDGFKDFQITYPDGDQQIIYYFGVKSAQPIPTLSLSHANTVQPGETLTITLTSSVPWVSLLLTVNHQPLTVDAQGHATITPTLPGLYTLHAQMTDATGQSVNADSTFIVTAPQDKTPPVVAINTPTANSEITAPVNVVGTVFDANLLNYTLALSPHGQGQYTVFAEGNTTITNQPLGNFDPTLLTNGLYDLRLTATDVNGRTSQVERTVQVTGQLKVGHFSITFEDLTIPVAGMPITLRRTYDSRRKQTTMDFGYGWSLDYQTLKVEENQSPSTGWQQVISGGMFFRQACLQPTKPHYVAITFPDDKVETFDLTVSSACTSLLPGQDFTVIYTQPLYTPRTGTFSKLIATEAGQVMNVGDDRLLNAIGLAPYDPIRYTLTTPEGYLYFLNQNWGLVKLQEPNGYTLTFQSDGIYHSTGKSVLFTRDDQGRITTITDPKGQVYQYHYDTDGNLIAMVDPAQVTTHFKYDANHYLTELQDPLGRTVARNEYDETGRLVAVIDPDGKRTDFQHDINQRQAVITNRLGHSERLVYDDRGNVLEQTDALGGVTQLTYDNLDNLLSRTDPLNQTLHMKYDAKSRLIEEQNALGQTVKTTYTARGQEQTRTDARNYVFTKTYDAVGNLTAATDPLGNQIINTLDQQGLVIASRDAAGNTLHYTYDTFGNRLTETDPLGQTTTYTYDANGNRLSESRQRTTATGEVITETTTYQYDSRNRKIATTDALGNTTRTEYHPNGKKSAWVDALGRRTEYEYDVQGRLLETRFPDGSHETHSYDAQGNLLSVTDQLGHITRYEYDALNRRTKEILADNKVTQTDYDAAGRVTAVTNAQGYRTTYTYDAAGRTMQVTNALEQAIAFEHDANGNVISQTDALHHTTRYEYDALNRRTKTIFPDGSIQIVNYHINGQIESQTDQDGITTAYTYDALNRLVAVTDNLGGETQFSYDEMGNKLTQTDANGHTTHWSYDSLGRQVAHTLPLGMIERFEYGPTSALQQHTNFNGQITTFSYDDNNRPLKICYTETDCETYQYDAAGFQRQVTTAWGTTGYVYDSQQRLLQKTLPNQTILEYGYDAIGNRTQLKLTFPQGESQEVKYEYDALGRLTHILTAEGTTVYGYDAGGNLQTVTYPNGTRSIYQYDTLNRLVEIQHQDRQGEVLASYHYTLSSAGRRTAVVEETGRQVNYHYDELGRLVEEKVSSPLEGEWQLNYQYDAVGNRLQQRDGMHTIVYQYDANDRLLTAGEDHYEYDAEGNQLSRNRGTEQVQYGYDAQQRLVEVLTETGQQIRYEYDADGHRVTQAVNGKITTYVVDDNLALPQVVAELDGQGQVKVSYVYGERLLTQQRDGEVSYYHTDGLGSTRLLTDEAGREIDRYDYKAFGELLRQTGSTSNNYLFAGEWYEAPLEQYDLRARFYDPNTGRFTQRDRFEGWETRPVSLHKYLYANGDPVNYIDPTGNFALTVPLWMRATFLLGIAGYLGGVEFYIFQRVDSRKALYFDISGINLSNPCSKRGCWDLKRLQTVVIDTVEKDFKDYSIELYWDRAAGLNRQIKFGGSSPGWIPKTYFGLSGWPWGWVFTEEMIKQAQEFNLHQKNFIDTKRLGTAIGNTGSHEAGHLIGMDHDQCHLPLTIMTAGQCISVWSLSREADWSSQSKNLLTSRFSKK